MLLVCGQVVVKLARYPSLSLDIMRPSFDLTCFSTKYCKLGTLSKQPILSTPRKDHQVETRLLYQATRVLRTRDAGTSGPPADPANMGAGMTSPDYLHLEWALTVQNRRYSVANIQSPGSCYCLLHFLACFTILYPLALLVAS